MRRLTKLHGLGNDFLVLLDEQQDATVDPDELPDLARQLCDRRRGVGADGLLHGARPDPREPDGDADVVMVLHNADGSRAEMSGNGIRCLGHAVAVARGITTGSLRVRTDAGVRVLTLEPGSSPDELVVAVAMGSVAEGPAPTAAVTDRLGGARHATVDVGNPHLVVEVTDPWSVDLAAEGPPLEAAFPAGVNVEFVAARPDGGLDLVVWERGAGITQACGTGATAAVAVAHRWGLVGAQASVHMPGGQAEVVLAGGEATLRGPSVFVAWVEVPGGPPAAAPVVGLDEEVVA